MLHVYFKRRDEFDDVLTEENYRISPSLWFDYQGGADYILGDFERAIIKDIDRGNVLSNQAIDFPVLGVLSPSCLSGTSKALILANNEPGVYVNGDYIGENGYKWLLKIAETKDLYLHATGILDFKANFTTHIINDDSYATNWREFLEKGVSFL